jgi:hypothetical protein
MKASQIARIADGKFVELWGESDVVGMREQLQANSRTDKLART